MVLNFILKFDNSYQIFQNIFQNQFSHKMSDSIITTLQYRNAIYYGQINKRKQRNGFGLLVTDDNQIILADWNQNHIRGSYFFTNSSVYSYGSMYQRKFDRQNVFINKDIIIYAECKQNLFDGNVLIKSADNHQAYQFKNGEKIKQIQISTRNDPLRELFKNMKDSAQLFIQELLVKQKKSFIHQIQLQNFFYYGGIDVSQRFGEGLGFVLVSDKLFSCGNYVKSDLNGIGNLNLKHEINDGIFKNGALYGIGVRWNSKKQEYIYGNFKDKQVIEVISKGKTYPKEQIRIMKNEFHLRSINFINDWIIIQKLISVDLSNIFKDQNDNKSNSALKGLLKQHFPSNIIKYQIEKQILKRNKQKTNKHEKSKSPQKINYIQNINIQQANNEIRNSEFKPYSMTNKYPNDQLITAIRQYEVITQLSSNKKYI